MNEERDKLKIMVSSTVYGIEELLDRVYTLLTSFGYEVWMSHKGTVPVFSNRTAFENCLQAVKDCDLFLGIITPTTEVARIPKIHQASPSHIRRSCKQSSLISLGGFWLMILLYLPVRCLTISAIKTRKDGRY